MTTTIRLAETWCSCLVQPVVSLSRGEHAVALLDPCWAHVAIGPAGFMPGERRTYRPDSLLDRAVSKAAETS